MGFPGSHQNLLETIVDKIDVGILIVNKKMQIMLWNKFMESHSGVLGSTLIGSNLFETFPELPRKWLEKKINSVFLLNNFAFTSWEHRPYLFKFQHNRPITGGVDYMRQSCTFQPLTDINGEVAAVCITIFDVTDTSMYYDMLQESMAELKELSIKDSLTGLFNRVNLERHLMREFKRYQRYGGALSLVMFDIDHFKKTNDIHGHLIGDDVLREVANRVDNCIRTTDFAGRYGGEEFVIVLTNTHSDGAFKLAERLREAIHHPPVKTHQLEIPVTISIGITEARPDTKDHIEMIREADAALYESKGKGRNRSTLFNFKKAAG